MSLGFEFIVSLGAFIAFAFLPGVLVTYWLFPGPKLDLLERIPIGFALMLGLLPIPIAWVRFFGWNWDGLLVIWSALIVFILGLTVLSVGLRERGLQSPVRFFRWISRFLPRVEFQSDSVKHSVPVILIGLFLVLLIVVGVLTQIGPNDEGDWSNFTWVRQIADMPHFTPLSLSDRNAVHPWWFLLAGIVHYLDVDLVRLGQNWEPLVFAPMVFLAFYALARALFGNQGFALLATLIQILVYLTDLFYADTVVIWNGWWIIAHMVQDHTVAMSILLPVFAALLVRYLREGGWILLGTTIMTQMGMVATHGLLGALMPFLTVVLFVPVRLVCVRERREWKKMGMLLGAMGILYLILAPVIRYLLITTAPSSAFPVLLPTDTYFPLSRYRYTFLSPTLFTMKWEYLGHPPILAALVLTLFLIPFLRRDLTAQFLFGTTATVVAILYVPFLTMYFDVHMTAGVERLWYWIPAAFIIAYFLPYFHRILRDGWLAWCQRSWNRQALYGMGLVVVFAGWLAIWPFSLLGEWPKPLGPGHALPGGAYEMLRALRDHTDPDESSVVLAWRDITDAIPAYRATLMPVLFREDPTGKEREDADTFFGSMFVTTAHLDILKTYGVKYLIISGDREFISQFDLLPEYFQPLYRNAYGTLYRVTPSLESNELVRANTIANYGDWSDAIQAYNAVLEDDPNNSLAHTGLGIILELLGKPSQAVREFEAAVNASPVNAQAHYHLVNLYRKLGMDEEAAKHVQPAGRLMENSHTWNLEK